MRFLLVCWLILEALLVWHLHNCQQKRLIADGAAAMALAPGILDDCGVSYASIATASPRRRTISGTPGHFHRFHRLGGGEDSYGLDG